jgi:hypothetical protein
MTLGKKNYEPIILIFGAIIVLGFCLYNNGKKKKTDMMTPSNGYEPPAPSSGDTSNYANVKGVKTNTYGAQASKLDDPGMLLPNDDNSQWGSVNPQGSDMLKGINFLSAGALNGINTVGSTMRNANLQLRSEPPNPKGVVGPWNNSTIEPDDVRPPLETKH